MIKISVIVPVYKVEKYLKECIDSILNQTFSDLELILVDDGSPDNSGKICDEVALKDERIKVIHKENGGLSSARNAALDIISGEYVCFVDSDDIIHKKMLEILYSSIQKTSTNIGVAKFEIFKDSDIINTEQEIEFTTKTINSEMLIEKAIIDYEVTFSVCNKMFKSSLWDDVRFREKTYFEDEDLTYKIFDKAKICVLCDCRLYFYRMNNESITRTLSPKIIDQYYTRKGMYEFIRFAYPQIASLCYLHWFFISIFIYYKCKYILKMNMDKLDFLYKFQKEILRDANKTNLSKNFKKFIKLYIILPFPIVDLLLRLKSILD